jgi:hypothetical protein
MNFANIEHWLGHFCPHPGGECDLLVERDHTSAAVPWTVSVRSDMGRTFGVGASLAEALANLDAQLGTRFPIGKRETER